jgi:hypothetical protein
MSCALETVAGSTITLSGKVRSLIDGTPKTSGTIYAALRCCGGTNDGKYWDSTSSGSWQATPAAYPTASYSLGDVWLVGITAGMTTGAGAGAFIILEMLSDNIATPASSTTIAGSLTSTKIVTNLSSLADNTVVNYITAEVAPKNTALTTSSSIVSLTGDVAGKVLGGGASTITGTGCRAVDAAGNAIATQTTATKIDERTARLPDDPADASDVQAAITASELQIAILTKNI